MTNLKFMTRSELFKAASRLPSWQKRIPASRGTPCDRGLDGHATYTELQTILGDTWAIARDTRHNREYNATLLNCQPINVRLVTRKEFHAAQHVAVASREQAQ